ncbi:MAG: C10 family peptidase [Prevotella sp.]|nr:C10 family peptidase [Prevotella sp.]
MQFIAIDDRQSDAVDHSPYYIFSRGAGQGFVIASGDDATAPIIGYTELGDYDEQLLPEPLRVMLCGWAERISRLEPQRATAVRRSPRARAIAAYKQGWKDVAALTKTHWHQSSPYNDLAPVQDNGARCATGCVATAGAQVAYYFRKDNPSELQYNTPTYGYGVPVTTSLPKGTPIEWDLMRLSGSGTAAQNHAVATLVFALGASAGLTYGASTSGHNYRAGYWNMADALKGQFRLNYSYKGKWECSQQAWEELIYSNLETGRPMLYSGVHPDNGGHSVVLDGYQASTGLYHFNFGWGGQGDGWYTVDDATGMNGFNSSQDLVYNFTPQVQNMTGELKTDLIYHKAPSTVSLSVTNNGTLDFQGIYLYSGTTDKPTGQPVASDVRTVIPVGQTVNLDFTLTTNTRNQVYVFLCDKNKRVLDSCLMEVRATAADLHLSRLSIDAGTEKTTVDGMDFLMVNNTTATVTARLTNGTEGTFCQPAFQCYIEEYVQQSQTWKRLPSVIINNMTFDVEQTREAEFAFKSLTPGTLYRAYLNHPAVATQQTSIAFDTPDSIAYFTVREADLAVVQEGRQAVVTGRWNRPLFRQLADDNAVCSYDISGLTELNEQPQTQNPNALFFATAAQQELQDYDNVVVGDVCRHLKIQTDADFLPSKSFSATKASLTLMDAEAGKWHGAVVPFAANVPYGMQVKTAKEWGSTIVSYGHMLSVEAMSPIIYLTGHDDLREITADDVAIGTDPQAGFFDGQLVATTVRTPIETTWLTLDYFIGSIYYLSSADRTEVGPFQSYVMSSTGSRMRTTTASVTDAYYAELAQAINAVYQAFAERSLDLPADAPADLAEALADALDELTYRQATADDAIAAATRNLKQALATFLENDMQGIAPAFTAATSAPQYYSLSGQRLPAPRRGIVVVRQGSTARKIMIK